MGIFDPAEIAEVELVLLEKLYQAVLIDAFPDRRLEIQDLKTWHRRWLGNLYDWAGEERSVNLSKGDFHFAAAAQIPRLLEVFERDYLACLTPCRTIAPARLAYAIAVTHVELILIHPFREGNGRLARLLADVMAVQAGRDPLDYSLWDSDKPSYFSAIQTGLTRNYDAMIGLVDQAMGQ
ncbi:Fic/DOC family protein [Thiocapsa bogorovii]|uniref:Fic/DOC family protein n=1 Tax=Thiocapsa bogorovii TaxID=521689 RepID=UPI001E5AA3AE|nr:Fic family protein [Thiocapsa bogorovii]UHD16817.1 Fic family protein [Thiocapsa bogorovii]